MDVSFTAVMNQHGRPDYRYSNKANQ